MMAVTPFAHGGRSDPKGATLTASGYSEATPGCEGSTDEPRDADKSEAPTREIETRVGGKPHKTGSGSIDSDSNTKVQMHTGVL